MVLPLGVLVVSWWVVGGRHSAVTASLSGKERCWSAVPVGREGSKTEVRSENLAIPLLAVDSAGAEMEPGNVSTRAAPVESAQGPDPSGSQPGSLGSAEPQFRHLGPKTTLDTRSLSDERPLSEPTQTRTRL